MSKDFWCKIRFHRWVDKDWWMPSTMKPVICSKCGQKAMVNVITGVKVYER